MQNLGCLLHGIDFRLTLKAVDCQRHHPIEGFHTEVVVLVFLELRRGIDHVGGVLAIIGFHIVVYTELLATTGHGTVLRVMLNTLHKALNALRRELQSVFLIS